MMMSAPIPDALNANRSSTHNWPLPLRIASGIRRGLLHRLSGAAVVLMYHRVCDLPGEASDPAELVTPVSLFEEHLSAFKDHFLVLPLSEVVSRIRKKERLPANTLCFTFDDGYLDTFTTVLPLLEQYQCPSTVFVSTAGLDASHRYWWEEHAPGLYAHVDADTLRDFSDNEWLDIGGHTHSHPRLTELDVEAQRLEIEKNRDLLTEICGRAPLLFAYPFGMPGRDWNETSARLVRESSYTAACSIDHGMLSRVSDLYRIPRFDVHAMAADEAVLYLKKAFGF